MAGRGKKDCPECKEEVGARLVLCECGYHFLSKSMRKDLIQAREVLKEAEAKEPSYGRGKKGCPECSTELGARTQLCGSCGYHYPSQKVRKDLLEAANALKEVKVYTSLGPGRKSCPKCKVIVGGTTKICHKCNFDFVSAKKEKDDSKEEAKRKKQEKKNEPKQEKETSSLTKKLLLMPKYEAPHDYTPKEHAIRILDLGRDKAENLLQHHKTMGGWGHVDWKFLEEELVTL